MRALRLASRGVVLVWALTLAAWLGAGSVAPPEEPRAKLQAVARAEPAPAPAPEPSPASERPPAPEPPPAPERPAPAPPPSAPARVTAEDLARGDALLGGAGRFPVLSASYDRMPSFRSYADAMAALGARFVVVSQRRIVAEIDLARGTMREPSVGARFSPRARDYSDEPALSAPARRVRDRFGPDAEIMLLVPRALDAGLFGGIARLLAGAAEPGGGHADFREIEGRYEQGADGGLRLRLVSGTRLDGSRVPLRAVFDLDAIAAGGSG